MVLPPTRLDYTAEHCLEPPTGNVRNAIFSTLRSVRTKTECCCLRCSSCQHMQSSSLDSKLPQCWCW